MSSLAHNRFAMCQRRRVWAVGPITVLAVLTAVALVAADPNTLCLLPALALALPLWLRRYPGERMLATLSRADQSRTDRGVCLRTLSSSRTVLVAVRGSLLLACSLAVRPPPTAPLVADC